MPSKRIRLRKVDPATQALWVATVLPLRRYRDILPFMRLSGRVERQVKRSPGGLAYGLKTNLPKKRFWTVSVWADRAALQSFVRAEPHAQAIKQFPRWAAEGAAYIEWTAADGCVDWREAMQRLRSRTFTHAVESKENPTPDARGRSGLEHDEAGKSGGSR